MKYSKEDIWQETKDYISLFYRTYYLRVRIHAFYLTLPNYNRWIIRCIRYHILRHGFSSAIYLFLG